MSHLGLEMQMEKASVACIKQVSIDAQHCRIA